MKYNISSGMNQYQKTIKSSLLSLMHCALLLLPSNVFSSPIDSVVLDEAVAILSNHFNTEVKVVAVTQLSEEERRNFIARIAIQNEFATVPKSVIFKQTIVRNLEDESYDTGRFARDWAGLEFLSALTTDVPPVPKFYGGNIQHKFMLLEDLGENHVSLVDSLTGGSTIDPVSALFRFMTSLGRLHACSYNHTDSYTEILKKLTPTTAIEGNNVQIALGKTIPAIEKALKNLDITLSEEALSEINSTHTAILSPGPFTALIHGDICPDNVFDNPEKEQLHLIDFEWGSVKNALLDGTYLRMSFPTCWCSKAIPEELIEPLEAAYRKELMKTMPAAKNDEEYFDAYTYASAWWMLKAISIANRVLEHEDKVPTGPVPPQSLWDPTTNLVRPRVLSRLAAFITVAKKHKRLPHLASLAEQVLKKLETEWPDAKPQELYPVFKSVG